MDTTQWLKGNTHLHTVRSDGDATIEQAAEFYAKRDYDFIAVTDHNRYLRPEERNINLPSGFIVLGGSELSYRSAATLKPVDVCSIGGIGEDSPGNKVVVFNGGATGTVETVLKCARDAGGLPVVCHPCWRWALSADDLLGVGVHPGGDFLLEIMNPSSDCNSFKAGGVDCPEDIWSKLLTAGRRVWAVAADDAHRIANPTIPPLDGGCLAWIKAGAAGRTEKAIVDAMRAGRFFCSTGVHVEEWVCGPDVYSVRVRQVRDWKYTIRMLGAGGRELATAHAASLEYRVHGDEGFVRARIEDSSGRRAWTQPLFV